MSDDEDGPPSPAADDISFSALSFLGQNRKQAQLAERAAQLRRRNQLVTAKVQDTKRQKSELEAYMSAQMLLQMSRAGERRSKHLESVREKARFSRQILEKRASEDAGTETSAVWPVESVSEVSEVSCPQLRTIARAVRRYRLRKAFRSRQCRLYFDKIVAFEISFSEAVILLRSPAIACVENLLHCLGLPHSGEDNYRWFLYSIVLISDFHESLERSFSSSPGFNVNLREPSAVSVHLPIMLYHLALRMFYMLRSFTDEDVNPWSPRRLVFARNWRTYHFLFSIFRINHKGASQKIAEEAFTIGSTQHRLLDAYGLLTVDDNMKENIMEFRRHSQWLKSTNNTVELSWAQNGSSAEDFCSELKTKTNELQDIRDALGNELFYDDSLATSPSLPFQEPQSIQFGPDSFTIPPMASLETWRTTWFNKLKHELQTLEHSKTPLHMSAGLFHKKTPGSSISATDMAAFFPDKYRQYGMIGSRSEVLIFKLEELFHVSFHLCKHMGKAAGLRQTELQFLGELRQYRFKAGNQSEESVSNFIRLLILLVVRVSEIAQLTPLEAHKSIIDGTILPFEELLDFSEMVVDDLYVSALTSWTLSCTFSTAQEFVVFENLLQLVTHYALSRSMGNDFPHVRFSTVYAFLYEYSTVLRSRFKPFSIVRAKELGFDFDGSCRNPIARQFYKNAFLRFFLSCFRKTTAEKVKPLLECGVFLHFQKDIQELATKGKRLVLASTFSTALSLSHGAAGELLDCFTDYDCIHGFELPKTMSDFQASYIFSQNTKLERGDVNIVDIFAEKIIEAMSSQKDMEMLLRKNIRHHISELLGLQKQIDSFTDMLYEIYYPVLNWIHSDLGSPK